MLHGAALVRLLVPDGGDDADLRIAPAHDADAGRLAQRRGPPSAATSSAARSERADDPAEIDGDPMLVGREAHGSRAAEESDGRPAGSRRDAGPRASARCSTM